MNPRDELRVKIEGHIKIVEYLDQDDLQTGKVNRVMLDKRNAIHKENASIIIARALAGQPSGSVFQMAFGTGGSTVGPTGVIVFATPNTTGAANLNQPVYFELVDDLQGAPSGNSLAVRHINGTLFSDLEIRCVLDKNEPFGQAAFSNAGTKNVNTSNFMFDEIALKTEDDLLMTHVVFSPVEKAADRIFECVYSLRIRIA